MCRNIGEVVYKHVALDKANKNMVSIGKKIRRLRISRGWLQKDLALKIDSESSFISRVECGCFANIGNVYLTSFAMAFDMEVHELLCPDE